MSTIKIVNSGGFDNICAECIQIQLIFYRNNIKEQYNSAINDGAIGKIKEFNFMPNPKYLWEIPITMVNGSLICLTHYMQMLNKSIESMSKTPLATGRSGDIPGLH